MAESKDTITVRVNIEMTIASLEMIVEKAKEKAASYGVSNDNRNEASFGELDPKRLKRS